jgi:hypothetical protein
LKYTSLRRLGSSRSLGLLTFLGEVFGSSMASSEGLTKSRCYSFGHLHQEGVHHAETATHTTASAMRSGNSVALRVFISAVLSSAVTSEFTLDFRMDKYAFVSILALGEVLAGILGMNELALIVSASAMRPMTASNTRCLFYTSRNRRSALETTLLLRESLTSTGWSSRGVIYRSKSIFSLLDQSVLLSFCQVFLRLKHVFHLNWGYINWVAQLRVLRL